MSRPNGLTEKEKNFAEEYVANGYKAVPAYLKAYKTDNEDTAKTNSYQVLKRDRVKNYIKQLQQEGFEAACINAERVAQKLAEIAFADKKDEYYAASAQLKALDLLQKQLGCQTQKIDANVKTTISVTIDEDAD